MMARMKKTARVRRVSDTALKTRHFALVSVTGLYYIVVIFLANILKGTKKRARRELFNNPYGDL